LPVTQTVVPFVFEMIGCVSFQLKPSRRLSTGGQNRLKFSLPKAYSGDVAPCILTLWESP
ncbi:MAG: hypothetical protein Q8M58_14405, partial [Anaerolineales bacterium]|nr:hypothetical protein [Anaerolineales bacterium]